MIDLFLIFTTGGTVLWKKELQKVPATVVNSLVSDVLIEGSSDRTFTKANYTVKFSTSNERGVIVAGIYSSLLQLPFCDQLVEDIKKVFVSMFSEELSGFVTRNDLDLARFDALVNVRIAETDHEPEVEPVKVEEVVELEEEGEDEGEIEKGEKEIRKKTRRGKKKTVKEDTPKKGKKMRTWGEDGMALEHDNGQVLDYSGGGEDQGTGFDADQQVDAARDWGSSTKKGEFVLKELSTELEDILNETPDKKTAGFGFLRNFIGGKKLSEEDLKKALQQMRAHLIEKNVAGEVADYMCEMVDKSLVGSTTESWTSVEKTVKKAMTEALTRILTPKTSLDLLHEVQNKQGPYVISVVGVNGVGKSTNLSKLGFWLLQNKYKVLVAACDTFRSGAVEQLKVHVRRLQELSSRLGSGEVQIFDQGYGKDAAVIAQKAIDHAKRNNFDVVLIDTAGRRHNDDRLMSSLEKFGKLAQPDKIIMVGEALVGTDSVQQAKNFNNAFGKTRNLDFFLISKCDTVGDMIGSMVNMTWSTGIPVLFVGIGQNYTDLRTLSVEWAVDLLMK